MPTPRAAELRNLVRQGRAMPAPGQDRPGRFPIRDADDLGKAINAIGRVGGGEEERAKVRRYVIKRARELRLASRIPVSWRADGHLKT